MVSLFNIRCDDLKGEDLNDNVDVPELIEFEPKELPDEEENEADLRNLCCCLFSSLGAVSLSMV